MPRLTARGAICLVAGVGAVTGCALVAGWPSAAHPSRIPSLVHQRLTSAEREVVADGLMPRVVVSIGGAARFGPATCHPAVVVGQRPRPGTAARRGGAVVLFAGPGSVGCGGAIPRGDGAVLGLLASSGAIWSGDVTSSGTIVASSHVGESGAVRAVRVARTGVFELVLPAGEWHLTGFTAHLVNAPTGRRAACDGGDVAVRAGRTAQADVVCAAI